MPYTYLPVQTHQLPNPDAFSNSPFCLAFLKRNVTRESTFSSFISGLPTAMGDPVPWP